MVSTISKAPTNRQELLERILEIIEPLLSDLSESLDRYFSGILLIPLHKGSSRHAVALTSNGRLYSAPPDTKNPWQHANQLSLHKSTIDEIYPALISVLLAKAGQKPDHAQAIQERLMEIHTLVREYASLGLPAEPLVSHRQSITNISFDFDRRKYSDGREETLLTAKFSALCPLRRSGCRGSGRLEDETIAVGSVLGERVMLFTPKFLNSCVDRYIYPLYCNARECGSAFGLSSLNVEEVVDEAKNFLWSKGYGFEPIQASLALG